MPYRNDVSVRREEGVVNILDRCLKNVIGEVLRTDVSPDSDGIATCRLDFVNNSLRFLLVKASVYTCRLCQIKYNQTRLECLLADDHFRAFFCEKKCCTASNALRAHVRRQTT